VTTNSAAQNHEEQAVGRLRKRLQARFSERAPADVSSVVDRVTRRFATARIRDYIPLLVERISRDELNHRFD
jgi:hypothetical protein